MASSTTTAAASSAAIPLASSTTTAANNIISSTTTTTATTASTTSAFSTTTEKMLNVADLSSSLQHFGWIDYSVFILMLAICAVIGFYFGFVEKRQKNKRSVDQRRGSEALDYLVGGRKMKVFPVSLSLVASFVSGISLLGTSTEIYVYGTQYAFILITLAISGVISWYVYLPVFCNLQLTSTYEYFEMRFDRKVRLFGSIMFLVLIILYMPVTIYVPALTFNQVTGIDVHTITPVVCIVCTIYTCIGGIKGVIWTDVLQSFIMLASLVFVIIKGTMDVGGIGEVYKRNLESGRLEAPEWTLDPTVRMGAFAVFIGGTFFKLQGICIMQAAVQRFLSLPNMRSVKRSLISLVVGLCVLLGLCVYIGLLAYAHYYQCDPMTTKLAKAKDQIVPLYVMEIAGQYPGVAGLFVAGIFSAALSSLSTCLNSLSGVLLKDFLEPYRKEPLSEKQTAIFLRVVVLVFGFSSLAMVSVVEKLGLVMQLSSTISSMGSGPLLGLFTVGMLMPFVKTKSVLVGCSTAAVTMAIIACRTQYDQAVGVLKYTTKPVSIEHCSYDFILPGNATLSNPAVSDDGHGHAWYHVSFLWYTTIGAGITIVVSVLATLAFGQQDTSELDPRLIVPFMRKYLEPPKYDAVTVKNMLADKALVEGHELNTNIKEILND